MGLIKIGGFLNDCFQEWERLVVVAFAKFLVGGLEVLDDVGRVGHGQFGRTHDVGFFPGEVHGLLDDSLFLEIENDIDDRVPRTEQVHALPHVLKAFEFHDDVVGPAAESCKTVASLAVGDGGLHGLLQILNEQDLEHLLKVGDGNDNPSGNGEPGGTAALRMDRCQELRQQNDRKEAEKGKAPHDDSFALAATFSRTFWTSGRFETFGY